MPFKKGEVNNPNGRAPASREKFNWEFLDTFAIPKALNRLLTIVNKQDEDYLEIKDADKRLKHVIDAAKALLAKAPERNQLSGANGAPLFLPSEVLDKHKLTNGNVDSSPKGNS